MLVLSRRKQQKIIINDDIVITVLDVDRGGQVRLGIEAPRCHRVLRHELYEQIQDENRLAQAVDPDLLRHLSFHAPGLKERS
jgi:carbon storage regulator